jgi:hypothetical protein
MGILDTYRNAFPPTPTLMEKELPSQAGKVNTIFLMLHDTLDVEQLIYLELHQHQISISQQPFLKASRRLLRIAGQYILN